MLGKSSEEGADAYARWTYEPRQGNEATSTSKAKADGGLRIQGVAGPMSPARIFNAKLPEMK